MPARPVGEREDHAAAARGRPRDPAGGTHRDRGRHGGRGRRRAPASPRETRRGADVPGLRAVSPPQRRAEHRVRAAQRGPRRRVDRARTCRHAPCAPGCAVSAHALRRTAAAHRAAAGARSRSRDPAARRAFLGSGRTPEAARAPGDPHDTRRKRRHHPDGDPQSGGGDVPRRSNRGPQPRAGGAGRLARRHLHRAGRPLHRPAVRVRERVQRHRARWSARHRARPRRRLRGGERQKGAVPGARRWCRDHVHAAERRRRYVRMRVETARMLGRRATCC